MTLLVYKCTYIILYITVSMYTNMVVSLKKSGMLLLGALKEIDVTYFLIIGEALATIVV